MAVILETDDLVLRTADLSFTESLLAYYLRNRTFLESFEPKRDPLFYTPAHQKALLRKDLANAEARTGFRFYIFRKNDSQTIIGSIALTQIVWGSFLSCFLGYKLDETYRNHGYMTQALTAVSAYAFQALQLHRIEASVMPRNLPSRRVLERCGFKEEGLSPKYLKINGVWEDHIHMVLLNGAL